MPDIAMECVHGERLRSIRPSVIMLPEGALEPGTYCIPGPIADHVCSVRMITISTGTIALGTEWGEYYQIYLLVNATPERTGRLIRLPQEYDSFDDMEDEINRL